MNIDNFVHREFFANSWEPLVKDYISNLECDEKEIWYRKREHNKIFKELIVLGYYVKYKYKNNPEISFKLNEVEGKTDGWIYKNCKILESVQIVIAHYEKKEAEEDNKLMNGEDTVPSGWESDRMKLLAARTVKRIKDKISKQYQDIDILLVGVNNCFTRRLDEYKKHKEYIFDFIKEGCIGKSQFQEFVIVDTDLVGKGDLLRIPNK